MVGNAKRPRAVLGIEQEARQTERTQSEHRRTMPIRQRAVHRDSTKCSTRPFSSFWTVPRWGYKPLMWSCSPELTGGYPKLLADDRWRQRRQCPTSFSGHIGAVQCVVAWDGTYSHAPANLLRLVSIPPSGIHNEASALRQPLRQHVRFRPDAPGPGRPISPIFPALYHTSGRVWTPGNGFVNSRLSVRARPSAPPYAPSRRPVCGSRASPPNLDIAAVSRR
jgi:hypothetical protein